MVHLVLAASDCDGALKGLGHPAWPKDAWDALRRLVMLALAAQRTGADAKLILRPR